MSAVQVDCICFEKGRERTILQLKISGVQVTPSVTSVESSKKIFGIKYNKFLFCIYANSAITHSLA